MISKDVLIDILTEELMTLRKLPASHIALRNKLLRALNAFESENKKTELKTMTVLMADIRGFSHIVEKSKPTRVIDMLNRYFAAMIDTINNHGGVVDKLMGDGVMALYGLNGSSPEEQANQACLSAVLMQKALESINCFNEELGMPSIHLGIGINTGKVLLGEVGSEFYSEYTAIGETVNMASRVKTHSLRGQILLTDSTYNLIASAIEVGAAKRVNIKGASQPVTLFELDAIKKPFYLQVPRSEDRKSPRIPVHLPLSFQCVAGKKVLADSYEGDVLDLSYTGMKARTSIYLPPMSDIRFKLAMGMTEDCGKNVYAKILRSDREDNDFYSCMEFTAITPASKAMLHEYVDYRM